MLTLKLLRKLFKILNGDVEPKQIAAGVAFGAIIGLTPFLSLHNLLVLFLVCIIKVNVSSVIFSALVFGLISYLVDPLSHMVGYFFLVDLSFLEPIWTFFYNVPIIALTRFNNTVVLGGLVISLAIFYPNLIFVRRGVIKYRESVQPKLAKTKLFKALTATKIYQWYRKISNIKDAV